MGTKTKGKETGSAVEEQNDKTKQVEQTVQKTGSHSMLKKILLSSLMGLGSLLIPAIYYVKYSETIQNIGTTTHDYSSE